MLGCVGTCFDCCRLTSLRAQARHTHSSDMVLSHKLVQRACHNANIYVRLPS
jgi:hypothetical protein